MRRTALLALAAAVLGACSDRLTAPDAAAPAAGPLPASAAARAPAVAPIPYVLSEPRVIGTVTGGWSFFRYPNRPAAELGGAAAVWQYRDDPFYGPMHVMRAPLSTGAATQLAQLDYAAYPTASERYTAWQSGDGTVTVMDNASGGARQITAPRTAPTTLRLVGDQLALLRSAGGGRKELVVYDLTAGTQRVVDGVGSDGAGVIGAAGFAFDGRYAAFAVTNNLTGIMVVDTRTGAQRLAVPYRSGALSAPWIDGGRLVYSLVDGGKTYMVVQDLGTGATRTVSTVSSPAPLTYPDTRLRQTDPRISGSLVVWTDTRRDSVESNQGYPLHTDVYLYDLATGVEMPVSTAPGWSGDARVSGNHLLWTQSRQGARDLTWELVTADLTPVSIPMLLAELRRMAASGAIGNPGTARSLEVFLSQAAAAQGAGNRARAVERLRQFAAEVHRLAGKQVETSAARRLEGIATGVVARL
jgi:hypothetical protein